MLIKRSDGTYITFARPGKSQDDRLISRVALTHSLMSIAMQMTEVFNMKYITFLDHVYDTRDEMVCGHFADMND